MDVSKVQLLQKLKTQISELDRQAKLLRAEKAVVEDEIMGNMLESGLTLGRTEFGTVSLKKDIVPNTKDWGEFEEFVYANRKLYLYQRRISATAYRDELKFREVVPGIEPFEKMMLSLTNAKSK